MHNGKFITRMGYKINITLTIDLTSDQARPTNLVRKTKEAISTTCTSQVEVVMIT